MRAAEARSRQKRRPEGVALCFQVSRYKIEPVASVLNLLSNDDCRLALRDEVEPVGPQMPLVTKPSAFACCAERLAGARACPNWAIVSPPSAAQGVAPDPDAGEEMALGVGSQVVGSDIGQASFIYVAGRDMPCSDQVSQPLSGIRIKFVVISGHLYYPGVMDA